MYEFKLPDLGEGIHEGEILKWYVEPGSTIREDDPLVDVETDKAAVTIPSPRGGRMEKLVGEVGQTVEVGSVIAMIDDGQAEGAAPAADKPAAAPPAEAEKSAGAVPATGVGPAEAAAVPASRSGPVLAAPVTRKLARELGVDLRQVVGSGPAGRVTPDDVRRAATGEAPPLVTEKSSAGMADTSAAPATLGATAGIPYLDVEPLPDFGQWGPIEREPVRSIRRKVARKMVTSMVLVPHVAHMDEADVTELEAFRRAEKARRAGQPGGKLTLLPFVMKAVTAGLKASPSCNASLDFSRGEIIYKKYYNIGFAADTGKGLIVPVVKEVDRKSILELSAEIVELATRARADQLQVVDLRGGTFTITNVGAIGGIGAIPTINYPEVAILALGRTQEKPVVRDGQIVVRKMLPLTLTFDHRVIDGADAARFVTALVRRLEQPWSWLLED